MDLQEYELAKADLERYTRLSLSIRSLESTPNKIHMSIRSWMSEMEMSACMLDVHNSIVGHGDLQSRERCVKKSKWYQTPYLPCNLVIHGSRPFPGNCVTVPFLKCSLAYMHRSYPGNVHAVNQPYVIACHPSPLWSSFVLGRLARVVHLLAC